MGVTDEERKEKRQREREGEERGRGRERREGEREGGRDRKEGGKRREGGRDGYEAAHNLKKNWYPDLMEQIDSSTYSGSLVTFEVGSRGFLSLPSFTLL